MFLLFIFVTRFFFCVSFSHANLVDLLKDIKATLLFRVATHKKAAKYFARDLCEDIIQSDFHR
jgi:hypothetical protein